MQPNLSGLDALMRPSSVAVLGASSDPAKIGGRPLRYLRDSGFRGVIYPVNPRYARSQDFETYPTVTAIGESVDLALIAVPSPAVVEAVTACTEAGVRMATIFSAGFAVASPEGEDLQREIAAIAAASGMRVLGPNCLCGASHRHGVSASFAASEGKSRPAGNVGGLALISQCGAVASYCVLAGLDRGITFDPWISTGNECDVQLADCLAYLALDNDVKVVAAYLEGCKDGDRLREALALAYERQKPVVLLRAGRSEVGARAVASHTAALVGSHETFSALVGQYNVCVADSLDDLMDLSYTFAFAAAPAGPRSGIVTSSGRVGILMADQAHDEGLSIPALPVHAQSALREVCPAAGVGNPIDTTAQLVNDGELLSSFLQTVLREGEFESLIVFLSYIGLIPEGHMPRSRRSVQPEPRSPTRTSPWRCSRRQRCGGRSRRSVSGCSTIPSRPCVPWVGPSPTPAFLDGLVPRPTEVLARARCLCLDKELSRNWLPPSSWRRTEFPSFREPLPVAHVRPLKRHATAPGLWSSRWSRPTCRTRPRSAAWSLGSTLPRPLPRRTQRILQSVAVHAPTAVDGVLVSPQVTGAVETIVGVANDRVFGPTVTFGLGRVFVESMRDLTFRLTPITKDEAMQMVTEIKGCAILEGARGTGRRDIEALAEAISTLSVIADEHRHDIKSIDLNPYWCLPRGQASWPWTPSSPVAPLTGSEPTHHDH